MALLKQIWAVMVVLSWGSAAIAGSCGPPTPPWIPTEPALAERYVEILKRDAEAYFSSVEYYFRCIDDQRRQVFEEARKINAKFVLVLSASYGAQ